jgi:hypothetical protein
MLLPAAASLHQHTQNNSQPDCQSKLFIHWTHHPKSVQQTVIRNTSDATLKDILPYERMQMALSHPKNLRDILAKAAVTLPTDLTIENLIQQYMLEKEHANKEK